jgi:hypothetical protein
MGGGAQKEAKPLILMWFRGSFGIAKALNTSNLRTATGS